MPTPLLARVGVLAAAFLFSTGGAAIKGCDLTSWQIAGFRSGIAALTILALLPSARRRPTPKLLLVGLIYALTLISFALANKLTTAANAIFLQATAPLYVLVLGPWLLGERGRGRDLVFGVALAAGLVLVVSGTAPATEVAVAPVLGNVLGVVTGVFWALTIVSLRWLESHGEGRGGAPVAVAVGNALAFLLCLPMALPVEASHASDWLWLGYLGVFQVAVAYAFLTAGLRRVPAFEASLLLMVEPMFSPLWAYWFFGEVPGVGVMIGGGAILAATLVKSWLDWRGVRAAHA